MSKRIHQDDLDRFLTHGVYVPTRTIYLGSAGESEDGGETGTDYRMAELAIKTLDVLDSQSAAPITVIMNNVGGDWVHGMAIYDAIRACRSPITIRGTGYVMSMGAVIFQAADTRVLTPNASMMIHYGTDAIANHSKIVERWAADAKRNNTRMEDIFLAEIRKKIPTYSRARIQKMLNFDTILTADAAVALGLADEVLK